MEPENNSKETQDSIIERQKKLEEFSPEELQKEDEKATKDYQNMSNSVEKGINDLPNGEESVLGKELKSVSGRLLEETEELKKLDDAKLTPEEKAEKAKKIEGDIQKNLKELDLNGGFFKLLFKLLGPFLKVLGIDLPEDEQKQYVEEQPLKEAIDNGENTFEKFGKVLYAQNRFPNLVFLYKGKKHEIKISKEGNILNDYPKELENSLLILNGKPHILYKKSIINIELYNNELMRNRIETAIIFNSKEKSKIIDYIRKNSIKDYTSYGLKELEKNPILGRMVSFLDNVSKNKEISREEMSTFNSHIRKIFGMKPYKDIMSITKDKENLKDIILNYLISGEIIY